MKRSKNIRIILIAGVSAGALAGCDPGAGPTAISSSNVYTNNFFVPGVGYYHAPGRMFYPYPYNSFDAQKHQYYFLGKWGSLPNESFINISSPTTNAAMFAEIHRTDIARGGFGCTAGGYGGYHGFYG